MVSFVSPFLGDGGAVEAVEALTASPRNDDDDDGDPCQTTNNRSDVAIIDVDDENNLFRFRFLLLSLDGTDSAAPIEFDINSGDEDDDIVNMLETKD